MRYLKQLQAEQAARGELEYLPKQEAAKKLSELERLERTLGGMRDMTQLPGAIFVIDPKREHLAIHEARRLKIPIIAMIDTNCDPDDVDFVIPANDDAIRSVRLLAAGIADAAIEGSTRHEIVQAERTRTWAARRVAADAEAIFSAVRTAAILPRLRKPSRRASGAGSCAGRRTTVESAGGSS